MPILPAHPEALHAAADRLRNGDLVAFPTETVYGLGADARQDKAVAKIFAAKGRPQFNPLITHLHQRENISDYVQLDTLSQKLIEAFWPGAMTLVLPRSATCPIAPLASAGLDSVALRMPAHPIAQHLLLAAGCPIAAPSANRSGQMSPTTAHHVADSLGDPDLLILDGGPCAQGLESTIVSVRPDGVHLLRPGAIPREDIEAVSGRLIDSGNSDGAITSPGQLESHYAPRAALRLNAKTLEKGEALLAFGTPLPGSAAAARNLSATGDLIEAAANLFHHLHALDKSGCACIAVMPIPQHGLGEAINDRLTRAAAPRS